MPLYEDKAGDLQGISRHRKPIYPASPANTPYLHCKCPRGLHVARNHTISGAIIHS